MKHPGGPDWHQDQAVIKSGLNHTGSQRSRCQPCRRYFTADPKPEGQVVSVRPQALTLDLEGTRFRAIGRMLGRHQQAGGNWSIQAANALPAQVRESTPKEPMERDERSTYVQQKKPRLCHKGRCP